MLLEALETLVGYISLHGEHPSVSTEGSWRWELLAVVASFAALYASHLLQQFLSRDSPKKRRAALRALAAEVQRAGGVPLVHGPRLREVFVHKPNMNASPLMRLGPSAAIETIAHGGDDAAAAVGALLDRVASLLSAFNTPAELAAATEVPEAVVARGLRVAIRNAGGRGMQAHASPHVDLAWLKLSAGFVFAIATEGRAGKPSVVGLLDLSLVAGTTRAAVCARVERDETALMLLALRATGAHAAALRDHFPLFTGAPPTAAHPCAEAWDDARGRRAAR